MTEKSTPGAFRSALGHWWNAVLLEQIPNSRTINGVPQFEQFAFNAVVAPTSIFPCQLEYQSYQFRADFRTPDQRFLLERPFTPNQLAMPIQDRVGLEDEHRFELGTEIVRDLLHPGDENSQ